MKSIKKLVNWGFLFATLLFFVAIIPLQAKAANSFTTLTNGSITALKIEGKEYYTFTIKEDSRVTFSWSNNNASRFWLEIYSDKNMTKRLKSIYPDAASGNLNICLKKGIYYVEMYDGYSASYTPTTKVKTTLTYVTKINKDNYCRGKALALAANKYATVCQTPNYDYTRWYKITLTKAQKVSFTFPNGNSTYITLISPTNQKYTLDTTSKSAVTKDKLAAGDYYIIVAYNGTYYTQNCVGVYVDFKWK